MGVLFFFNEKVTDDDRKEDEYLSVEVADNHSIPEIRMEPTNVAYEGNIASFNDWQQFKRFVDSVNSLYSRLEYINSQAYLSKEKNNDKNEK